MKRKRIPLLLILAGAVLLSGSLPAAGIGPQAVSPGDASKLALIGDACPTFSWGEVDEAKSYELVVYRLGEEGEEAEPVQRQAFPGSVYSWTPSLDACLERGGQYAWSVRAVGRKEASEWSAPSLFEVASGPSQEEFEEALAVVRTYLKEGESSAGEQASASRDSAAAISVPTGSGEEPIPRSHEGSGSAILVDGVEVETKADPPCYPSTGDADRLNRYITAATARCWTR